MASSLEVVEFQKGSDFQITKNFNAKEFDCRCQYADCLVTYIHTELVEGLQQFRDDFGDFPVELLSGYRCKKHNIDVGGSKKSYHLFGMAADITIQGYKWEALANIAKRVDIFREGGIGMYRWGLHLDNRGQPARWYG